MKAEASTIRPAAVAGAFYPADPATLRQRVTGLLGETVAVPAQAIAAIVPHAGYAYSGPCAAEVYARLEVPDTVVLLGPNHLGATAHPGSASVWRTGAFATPLGRVPVDEALADDLLRRCPALAEDPVAHYREHCLEVQLPFLLVRAAPGRPSIVPILLDWADWPPCAQLAGALAEAIRAHATGRVLLLGTTDMTHFASAAEAFERDRPALDAMAELDGAALLAGCEQRRDTVCGAAAVAVVLEAARRLGAGRVNLVAHTHSGEHTGDDSRVVSYAGLLID